MVARCAFKILVCAPIRVTAFFISVKPRAAGATSSVPRILLQAVALLGEVGFELLWSRCRAARRARLALKTVPRPPSSKTKASSMLESFAGGTSASAFMRSLSWSAPLDRNERLLGRRDIAPRAPRVQAPRP
eukprot:CAMPEP_0204186634 /NCGR_PEP_ID=MMETSP0361-20130328/56163_1 /ASSEMBLY_ACC=CAM_ASM_000343 /TAXON_ID=268821 /ORGANISM="Scrippsiella Hangoei, Strain SHTV-5" /LENGTH=131 /DNA_ID=CAMNT_0051146957 /DNA_START=326 /DNA_END=718 /DNA_ORIENTATION=-